MIHVVADLLGADRSPEELLPGAVAAVRAIPDLTVHLAGDEAVLQHCLEQYTYDRERIQLLHAPQAVSQAKDPMAAVRDIPDSSIMKGLRLSKSFGKDGAFVSCGPTAIIYVASMILLGRAVPQSPSLIAEIYKENGDRLCITDCGSVPDCDAGKLVDFARMGAAYMEAGGCEDPRIALLSIGAEDSKGSAVVREANTLLKSSGLHFLGNVEGGDVLQSEADLIVCDGFSGNVLLKTIEGSAKTALRELTALLIRENAAPAGVLEELEARARWKYNYNDNGGAILLGLNQPVVKGHGAAGPETLDSVIRIAYRAAGNRMVDTMRAMFGISAE